jgi:hypothetical protein
LLYGRPEFESRLGTPGRSSSERRAMRKQGWTLYEKIMKKFLKISSFLEQDGEKKEEEEAKQRAACKNKTFEEFLRKQNLTENLVHFVVYAIAMVRPDTPAEEGLLQTRFVPSPTVSCSIGDP